MNGAGRPDPERVRDLFEALADLEPAEADRRLEAECGGDVALREAVRRVLEHDRGAAPAFLAPRPALLADAVLGWDLGAPPMEAEAAPAGPAGRLGRYYVLHELAAGGMGVIYVGYDDALHRRVALKVLRRATALREWLLREGQALGRLAHPNVVSVYEVGEHEGRVFLAMELVEGPSLRAWLDGGPRPFAETLRLFLQAGRGLAAAHRAGLVHRDFKPENVLIGADGRARVADFGIVALARGAQPPYPPDTEHRGGGLAGMEIGPGGGPLSSPLTEAGVLMGTPAYMSPEQLRGERATPLSDQYSFCVALYRAAYGAAPHPIDDVARLAESVQRAAPAPPPRRAEVPAWLAPILLRGLAPDPARRFLSMDELLREVGRHLPRDPELDPLLVVRERHLISAIFVAGYVLASGLMLSEACARVLMRPAALVGAPATLLALTLAAIAWGWRGFSRNRYGRRLAGVFSSSLALLLGHRLIALRLGLSPERILVEDMVLFSTVFVLLAQSFERWFGWLAAFTVAGAVVGAFLPERAHLLVGGIGLATAAAMVARVVLDRHLTPEAAVGPAEDPPA